MRIADPIELKYPARLLRLLLLEERGLPLLGIQGVMQRPPSHLLGHLQVRTPGHQLPWKARTALLKVLHKANPKEFYVRTVRGGHNSIWFSCFFSCQVLNIHTHTHIHTCAHAALRSPRRPVTRLRGRRMNHRLGTSSCLLPVLSTLRLATVVVPLFQRKLLAGL